MLRALKGLAFTVLPFLLRTLIFTLARTSVVAARLAHRYGPRLDRWVGRLVYHFLCRVAVNEFRRAADVLRVVVLHLMRFMSSHRAEHPSTLPRLLLAATPVIAVPVTVLAVAVGMLSSNPTPPASAHEAGAATLTSAQQHERVERAARAEVSRSVHRVRQADTASESEQTVRPPQVNLGAIERERPLDARTYHRGDLQSAHNAKVARQQARREARERAEAKAAAKAARIAAAKAKARKERREAKALAAAQAAADAATAESLASVEPGTLRAQVLAQMLDYGFAADQWTYLDRLIMRESSWNPLAQNASSGAYGLPQALPGSKMADAGADWRTNPATQVTWMLSYISDRYTNPAGAWDHSESVGWY